MFQKFREMGNCLTPSGWSLIFVGGGVAYFASKNSSIDLIKALCPDIFNNETNSDEGRRLLETEAEQKKLEEQRKYNEEQLRRRMQELDSESFMHFTKWYGKYDMVHRIVIMQKDLYKTIKKQNQKELESVKKSIAELENAKIAS